MTMYSEDKLRMHMGSFVSQKRKDIIGKGPEERTSARRLTDIQTNCASLQAN